MSGGDRQVITVARRTLTITATNQLTVGAVWYRVLHTYNKVIQAPKFGSLPLYKILLTEYKFDLLGSSGNSQDQSSHIQDSSNESRT